VEYMVIIITIVTIYTPSNITKSLNLEAVKHHELSTKHHESMLFTVWLATL